MRSKRAVSSGWMSTKKKLGAVPGRRSFTCAAIVWSSSETVASRVRPRPSAVTTPVVAAPGRVRLASARRAAGQARTRQAAQREAQAFGDQAQRDESAGNAAEKLGGEQRRGREQQRETDDQRSRRPPRRER